jgi:hypothetical protein
MSSELLLANFLMLVLAVIAGAGYVYTRRDTSPYPPRIQDYLGSEPVASGEKTIGRAA